MGPLEEGLCLAPKTKWPDLGTLKAGLAHFPKLGPLEAPGCLGFRKEKGSPVYCSGGLKALRFYAFVI